MVRSVTFEIRWHDTQPIYSCSFQPLPSQQLRRVLDYNLGQGAYLVPFALSGYGLLRNQKLTCPLTNCPRSILVAPYFSFRPQPGQDLLQRACHRLVSQPGSTSHTFHVRLDLCSRTFCS